MSNIQAIYDSLWERSKANFENNQFELDKNLNNKASDRRRGISLIARLNSKTKRNILDFLQDCKLLESEQYYYQAADLHLTILSIISCYEGFELSNFTQQAYCEKIAETIAIHKDQHAIKISFQGITASPSCVMIQGFPQNIRLNQLRENLRSGFKKSILEHSIDQRYKLETAHSTVIRFKNQLNNSQLFLDLLKQYREYNFGDCQLEKLELVYNDWYMSSSKVTVIKTFQL